MGGGGAWLEATVGVKISVGTHEKGAYFEDLREVTTKTHRISDSFNLLPLKYI
jgi:hypothetical protein